MTNKNTENWRGRVKSIFKEAEEKEFDPAVSFGGSSVEGDADDASNLPEMGDDVEGGDEGAQQEPITITKALLVQLIDAAVQAAKGGGAVEEPTLLDAPLGDEPETEIPALDAAPEMPAVADEMAMPAVAVEDEAPVEDGEGIVPNLDVVPPVEGGDDMGGEEAGEVEGGFDDKPALDVAAVVDKAFELFSAKGDGTPLDVDVLDQLKAVLSGTSELPGNDDGVIPAVDGDDAGEVEGGDDDNGEEVEVEESKKKLKFT